VGCFEIRVKPRLEFGEIGGIIGTEGPRSSSVKIGDKVKLIGIPPDVQDDEKFQTRTLFEKCLGKTFTIAGFETVEGLPYQLVQLDVGHVIGQASYLQKIWVEPEYLQLETSSKIQNSPPPTRQSS
jgi:hypothetical protein